MTDDTTSNIIIGDWDVIERTRYSGECRDSSGFVDNTNNVIIVDRLSCYKKYRSDSTFRSLAVVETRSVRNAEECARECDYYRDSGRFDCNYFSVPATVGGSGKNCVLTDSYSRNVDADLVYDRDWTVFEHSGNSGGSCRQNTEVEYPGEYTVNGKRCRYCAIIYFSAKY